MTDTVSRPQRQAAFGFIFASALMNSISFGLMIPILPNLIRQMTGGDTAEASVGTWSSLPPGARCSSWWARSWA